MPTRLVVAGDHAAIARHPGAVDREREPVAIGGLARHDDAVRGGVGHKNAVAEVNRDTHEAELKTMARVFADAKTTDEVIAMLTESDEAVT